MKNEMVARMIHDVGSAAIILAMTDSMYDETLVKQYLGEEGYLVAVTEVGGNTGEFQFQEKLVKRVLGASLNNNIISKEAHVVHAVIHALLEAKQCFLANVSVASNVAAKVAVVRKGRFIAVGMYGMSAIYHLTNHERMGLGISHA